MHESHADVIALIVMTLISTAMMLFGDKSFGISVLIASVVAFLFSRYRTRHRDRW